MACLTPGAKRLIVGGRMSDNVPCKFCPFRADYAPVEQMERHGIKVYYCHRCQAEYTYFSDKTRAGYSLYTTINDKCYRWNYVLYSNRFYLWYIKSPGTPGVQANGDSILLKSFPSQDINNVTPSNIVDKIKMWLLFL